MGERLSEQQLAEIASRARHAHYYATFHGDHSNGSTLWTNAEEDILALMAEVTRLRAIEVAARAVLEHVAHPEEGYEELMALMEAVG